MSALVRSRHCAPQLGMSAKGARADVHRRHIIDIVLSKSSRITAREPDALSLIFFVPTLAFKFVVFPESVLVCWDSVGR